MRLFEIEIPEIYDGTVEIKEVAREAGYRSKVAVYSENNDVDPVGACVGPRGSRVQAVVDQLDGEKIDIVKWDPDPKVFIANALNPAEVSEVILNEKEAIAQVVVPDFQLSLAIGKEGQNARLAAKLTGWKVDIVKESEYNASDEDIEKIDDEDSETLNEEEINEVDNENEDISEDQESEKKLTGGVKVARKFY